MAAEEASGEKWATDEAIRTKSYVTDKESEGRRRGLLF
jgi:hypothetical protein